MLKDKIKKKINSSLKDETKKIIKCKKYQSKTISKQRISTKYDIKIK